MKAWQYGHGIHESPADAPLDANCERSPSPLAQGLALTPWATMLSIMVQTTVMAIGPLFGRLAFTTMTANTMLASPHCNAFGAGTAFPSLLLPLVPVMTRTEAVVPTRSLMFSGSWSK